MRRAMKRVNYFERVWNRGEGTKLRKWKTKQEKVAVVMVRNSGGLAGGALVQDARIEQLIE